MSIIPENEIDQQLILNLLQDMLTEMRQMRIMMEEITDARITTGEFEEEL